MMNLESLRVLKASTTKLADELRAAVTATNTKAAAIKEDASRSPAWKDEQINALRQQVLAASGAKFSAVAAGVVTHVGRIAGRGTVSVTHPGNIKSTYEPVLAGVRVGASVAAGTRLGSLEPVGSHCAPTTCLHLGALRRGSADQWLYVDPLLLLGDVEIVLLPKTR